MPSFALCENTETGVSSAKRSFLKFAVREKFPIDGLAELTPVVNVFEKPETGVSSAKRSFLNFAICEKFPIDGLAELTPVVNVNKFGGRQHAVS